MEAKAARFYYPTLSPVFVNIDSKWLSLPVSRLKSIFRDGSVSIDSTGLADKPKTSSGFFFKASIGTQFELAMHPGDLRKENAPGLGPALDWGIDLEIRKK
jgi:hypothetical protein